MCFLCSPLSNKSKGGESPVTANQQADRAPPEERHKRTDWRNHNHLHHLHWSEVRRKRDSFVVLGIKLHESSITSANSEPSHFFPCIPFFTITVSLTHTQTDKLPPDGVLEEMRGQLPVSSHSRRSRGSKKPTNVDLTLHINPSPGAYTPAWLSKPSLEQQTRPVWLHPTSRNSVVNSYRSSALKSPFFSSA